MKKSILPVTGAAAGIGHLAVKALALAGRPADAATVAACSRYDGLPDQVGAEIARIVGLPHGARPLRSVVDFIDHGAAAVTEVAERARIEFAQRIGIADLLQPGLQ